jgi:Agrobacterium tumefaciens protein Atu4866
MTLCPKRQTANATAHPVFGSDAPHPYVGLWTTEDGFIRQTLLADGRYQEARGPRSAASSGRYSIEDERIEYVEDRSGFTSKGRFGEGVLHHAGMALYRRHSFIDEWSSRID